MYIEQKIDERDKEFLFLSYMIIDLRLKGSGKKNSKTSSYLHDIKPDKQNKLTMHEEMLACETDTRLSALCMTHLYLRAHVWKLLSDEG